MTNGTPLTIAITRIGGGRYECADVASTACHARSHTASAKPLARLKSFSRVAHRPAEGVGMK